MKSGHVSWQRKVEGELHSSAARVGVFNALQRKGSLVVIEELGY